MVNEQKQTITIDGKAFDVADLSDSAKQQVANLQATDAEIEKLKQQMAIYQTARTAYARALAAELPKATH